ncbi:MAG: phenylalanine--tRNA ligase subunit alpha, partial [Gemmatimonadales bacterium]|nr:phenylalanine--tRNA ligase subunit alpha [Gemmatimonadales bacterium]NIP06170.1 phenylalanine--tRNA ligase subunit alpha [Gemmatimonadales bacterium]
MNDPRQDMLQEARRALSEAATRQDVEQVRVRLLGRKGALAKLFSQIPELPSAERPEAGRAANRLKQQISDLVEEAFARVSEAEA